MQPEPTLSLDIPVEVHAGRDLRDDPAVRTKAQHASLRNCRDVLASLLGMVSAERDMLDLVDKLSHLALVPDVEAPLLHLQVEAGRGEGAAEHDFAGVA